MLKHPSPPARPLTVVLIAVLAALVVVLAVLELTRGGAPAAAATPAAALAPKTAPFTVSEPPVAVIIGDSFAEGQTGVTRAFGGFAAQTAAAMGWTLNLDAQGGTGYASSPRTGGRAPIPDRIARHQASERADYVLITGGTNDRGIDLSKVQAGAIKTIREVRVRWPKARIIVVGPMWATADVPLSLVLVRDRVKAAAFLQGVDFIDPLGERWITPANQAGKVSVDNLHPSQQGHDLFAKKLAADLQKLGVPAGEKVTRRSWFPAGVGLAGR